MGAALLLYEGVISEGGMHHSWSCNWSGSGGGQGLECVSTLGVDICRVLDLFTMLDIIWTFRALLAERIIGEYQGPEPSSPDQLHLAYGQKEATFGTSGIGLSLMRNLRQTQNGLAPRQDHVTCLRAA